MQIIPALYIKDGKPAVFRPGEWEEMEFLPFDPYKLIERLDQHKIQRVFLIDIDAARGEGKNNSGLIASLSNTTVADLEVGGGLTNMDFLKSLQYAGVDHFVLSAVVFDDEEFLVRLSEDETIKNDRILVAVGLLNGVLTSLGWRKVISAEGLRDIISRCIELGFKRFICADIDTDQPDRGPDLLFYKELVQEFPDAQFSAAGHINTFEDVEALKELGIKEVIVGNRIYKEEDVLDQVIAYNAHEETTNE